MVTKLVFFKFQMQVLHHGSIKYSYVILTLTQLLLNLLKLLNRCDEKIRIIINKQ